MQNKENTHNTAIILEESNQHKCFIVSVHRPTQPKCLEEECKSAGISFQRWFELKCQDTQ